MQVILILKYIYHAWDTFKGHRKHLTWKSFCIGRSMIEGLLDWIPARAWARPRFWKYCLTVTAPSESSENKKVGQLNLTQLNPIVHWYNPFGDCIHWLLAKAFSHNGIKMWWPIHACQHHSFPILVHNPPWISGKPITSLLWEMTHWKIIAVDRRFTKKKREFPHICLCYGSVRTMHSYSMLSCIVSFLITHAFVFITLGSIDIKKLNAQNFWEQIIWKYNV